MNYGFFMRYNENISDWKQDVDNFVVKDNKMMEELDTDHYFVILLQKIAFQRNNDVLKIRTLDPQNPLCL